MKVMDLPGAWCLEADDNARPLLVHDDGRRLEPKEVAFLSCAQELYTALKLEEDKRARLEYGAERTKGWLAIWSARVVIGDYFNRRVNPEGADDLLHRETEQLTQKQQLERARLWTPGSRH